MSTILDKDLVRIATVKRDDREIIVTLTADQKISLKLKGMKSGMLNMDIGELWDTLNGSTPKPIPLIKVTQRVAKVLADNPTISLNELRTEVLITHMDLPVKYQLEKALCELLKREIVL